MKDLIGSIFVVGWLWFVFRPWALKEWYGDYPKAVQQPKEKRSI